MANKADPRVDTDRNGSGALGSTSGYGTGTGPTVGSAHQGDLNRSDVGSTTGAITEESLPKAYGEDTWIHDHQKHGHEFVGDPCEHEPPAPGALHFTPGPHSLDTTNRLDPHVGGESIGGTPSSTTDTSASSTGHHHHHHGRDAALGAGAGAAGVAAYEGSSGVPSSATTESGHHGLGRDTALGAETGAAGAGAYGSSRDIPSGSSLERDRATAGPHQSDTMNELDPRVDPDLSKQQRTSGTTGATTGTTGLTSTSTTDPSIGQEHHPGRDAALGAAGGAAVYEGAKHHGRDVPEGTSTSGYANPYPPGSTTTGVRSGPTSSTTGTTPSTDPTSISKDHHYGRDAGLAGAGAGAAYEADKHLRGPHGDTAGTRSTDLASAQQPTTEPFGPGYQRDTGLIGAGTTGHHDTGYQPSPTSGVAGQPAAYDERNRPHESHTGRNAALGAAAGTAAVAGGEELSKKDLEREQKAAHEQELREQKAAHKQEEKAEKHHQHELEKAEKKHQHELEKAEKAHEKKHEHKEEPHEGEKKHHHGLLGKLFHRDKSDKELKEEEAARKEHSEQEFHPGAGTAAAGVGGVAADTAGLSEKEKHERAKEHDRNRLHKDPPPGFGQTEYAEAPTEGYASQVTGGTGTTALAQGEPVPQGSHATGFGNKVDPK